MGVFMGLRWAVPVSLALWMVIAGAVWAGSAVAAEYEDTPGGQLGRAIELGRLPPWVSTGARMELRFTGLRVVTCLEDRERTQKWVTWGHWDDYLRWTITGRWTFRKAEPVPAEYWAMCGFPAPGPAGPVALGEPAYWSVICDRACASGKVAWADMSNPGNIAGTTVKGESCGAPVKGEPSGWYQLPRIQRNGTPAITRCAL